jgi:MFS family permease
MDFIEGPAMINTASLAEKRSLGFLIGLSVYNIGLNLMWISYSSILLPLMVQNTTSEATKGLWLGIISAVSIGAGTAINIVAGVTSDHSHSRWGRRNPTIVIGGVFTAADILAMALLPRALPVIFLGFFILQVAGNISSGAYQPLLADVVPENQRGMGAGFQGVSTIAGAALGFIAVTALVAAGKMRLALELIAGVFLLGTLYNALVIRGVDQPIPGLEQLSLGQALRETLVVRRRVPGFFWFLFANFLMYMGVMSFASYGIYYFQTVLKLADPVRAMGTAGLVGILVNVAAAVLGGNLSDRIGRTKLIIAAGAACGLVCLLFPFVHGFDTFLVLAGFYGAGNGVIYSVNQALASGLVPREEAGKFMAYNNLSIGAAGALAPLLFGAILNLHGAPTVGSFVLFFVAAAVFYWGSSVVFARKVPQR